MRLRHLLVLPLLALMLAACKTDAEPVPDAETATPSLEPTAADSPLSPPPTPEPTRPGRGDSPLPQPEDSPIATPADPAAAAVAAARQHLASELDIPTQQVQPVRAESVQWSDASLGCPEPGKAYAQVITPGYRIVLRVGEGEYELHSDRAGAIVVMCEPEP
jgi:hypothetical protein